MRKSYNVKLLWEDKDLVVKGLYERTAVNPFDFLEVQFTGNSPQIRVELSLKDAPAWMELSDVNISKREGLASGIKSKLLLSGINEKSGERAYLFFRNREGI